ncbi:DUF4253 domain-containing protein [Kitasatospora sp. NPDC004240]
MTQLSRLFPDHAPSDGPAPDVPLPPGRLTGGDRDEDGGPPVLWVGDGPPPAGLWAELHRAHPRSGLWPLLLTPSADGPDTHPWLSGDLRPHAMTEPDLYDPEAVLRRWWERIGRGEDEEWMEEDEIRDAVTPYDLDRPGRAPARPFTAEARSGAAHDLATRLEPARPLRLGLVPARTGAEALAVCGWTGPDGHEGDTARIAAVLADWEHRFGTQVVRVGAHTLDLSVATAPATPEEALPVAAEHLALCPDLVLRSRDTLTDHAHRLIGADHWSFSWG